MSDNLEPSFFRRNSLLILGISVTLILCIVFTGVALLPTCVEEPQGDIKCTLKWAYLLNAPPNEIGDAFAGIFGALAVVWLVISVAQQSIELKNQRLEFKNMVSAQNEQARALENHSRIFLDQQKRINENRAFGKLSQTSISALEAANKISEGLRWDYRAVETNQVESIIFESNYPISLDKNKRDNNFSALRDANREFIRVIDLAMKRNFEGSLIKCPELTIELLNFIEIQSSVKDYFDNLSEGSKDRATRSLAMEAAEAGKKAIAEPGLWNARPVDGQMPPG